MTITIEITPEAEALLQREAARQGRSPEEVARRVLEAGLSAQPPGQTLTEAEFNQQLLRKGILSSLPEAAEDEEDDFEPVEVRGEPVSETIIAERR